VRGIGREAALVVEGLGDAPDQRIERCAQRGNFFRQGGRLVERCQGLRVQRTDLARQRFHWP